MKEYRITASNFAPQEPSIPDAVMDDADLVRMRQLAGINETHDKKAHAGNLNPSGLRSPFNMSTDSAEKRNIEREKNIKPGSDEWFRLWFAKPNLTGEKPVGDGSTGCTNSLMSINVGNRD